MKDLMDTTRPIDMRRDDDACLWQLDAFFVDSSVATEAARDIVAASRPLPEWSIYDYLAAHWN